MLVPCIYRSTTACSLCLKHTNLPTLSLDFPATFWQRASMCPLCCFVNCFLPPSVCQDFVSQADHCSMTGCQSACGRWWVTAFAVLLNCLCVGSWNLLLLFTLLFFPSHWGGGLSSCVDACVAVERSCLKCVALAIRKTVYSKLTWNKYVVKTHLSLKRLSPKYVQLYLKVKVPGLAFCLFFPPTFIRLHSSWCESQVKRKMPVSHPAFCKWLSC